MILKVYGILGARLQVHEFRETACFEVHPSGETR